MKLFENGCYVGRAWERLGRVWIPQALRANESSASECREEVEGLKERIHDADYPMWYPGNHPAPERDGTGSSTPGRGGQSEVTYQGEGFSTFPFTSVRSFFFKVMLHAEEAWVETWLCHLAERLWASISIS